MQQRDGHVNVTMVLQAIVIYSNIDVDFSEALVKLRAAWQKEYRYEEPIRIY